MSITKIRDKIDHAITVLTSIIMDMQLDICICIIWVYVSNVVEYIWTPLYSLELITANLWEHSEADIWVHM